MTYDPHTPGPETGPATPGPGASGLAPAGPWWSVPEPAGVGTGAPSATAGPAPLGAPATATPATEASAAPGATARHGTGRQRTAALVAAALVVGGSAGGGIGALVADSHSNGGSTTATTALRRSDSTVTTSAAGSTVTGTPETAAAAVSASVVTVEVSGTVAVTGNDPFGDGGQGEPVSDTGSGVVLRADGYILTNNHVVAAAETGGSVHVTFSNGKTVGAKIVGHDTTSDLAVIKVALSGLKAATFANSDDLKVGQGVLAVGAPLGLSNSVTEGIVSTLHRPVATGESGASAQSVIDAVQTDAAINPGNSGGALVDLAGRVVGINSAIATTGSTSGSTESGNIGVGFAIPSNDATTVADQLIATGHATHAQIEISVTDASSATDGAPGLGATVRAVTAGGPAAKAGLRAGDVITKVGSRTVTEANGLIVAVRSAAPGSKVVVTFTRGGATRSVTVTLGSSVAS